MTYRVELSARAERDLEAILIKKNAIESEAAARWYRRLERAILSLDTNPHRCPVLPEAGKLKRDLRHLLFGNKPHVYRIVCQIDEKHRKVRVITVRHGARKGMQASDID